MSKTIPRVLIVDDEPDILELLELALSRMGLYVESASGVQQAMMLLESGKFDLCLTDMRMGDGDGMAVLRFISERNLDVPVAVITAHGNLENAVAALKAGAFDYLSKPVALDQLRTVVGAALRLPDVQGSNRKNGADLLGTSPAMLQVRELIGRVARSQAPVHISGESGSGKELAARMIVSLSARGEQPFVPVNCGAIPENLMESEFFGYRKGAFTGADKDKEGYFQAAHQGTLLLDEVADLPMAMQVKLLRVIQEKRVRRVGATEEEVVDVRILSSTHHDLAKRVQEGKFRQDLYYRLNVISLTMPSLREMRDDVPRIAQQILERLRGASKARFSKGALHVLSQYDFPGNVRELENVIERAVALCSEDLIQPEDLQLAPAEASANSSRADSGGKYPLADYLDRIEREVILEALAKTHFNRTAAAKILGVTFRALRYRMDRLSISEPDEQDEA
ncbi:MAG: sigma-54 dependent transcriptional regulator [Sideroxydans sp.]|nr:sigma-54 dependent transcriptional regulator [Sideroxydans sp.]